MFSHLTPKQMFIIVQDIFSFVSFGENSFEESSCLERNPLQSHLCCEQKLFVLLYNEHGEQRKARCKTHAEHMYKAQPAEMNSIQ